MNKLLSVALALCLCSLVLAPANAVRLTSAFSGPWFDPNLPAQGLFLNVLQGEQGPEAFVVLTSYDDDGQPLFIFGVGPISADGADVPMLRSELVPLGSFGVAQTFMPWGRMLLQFDSCDRGTAVFQPSGTGVFPRSKIRVGTGTLQLSRFGQMKALQCTGSIIDDLPKGGAPERMLTTLNVPGLKGRVRFDLRPGQAEFSVELLDMPIGSYLVLIDGRPVGSIGVTNFLSGTRGRLQLSSPVQNGDGMLDFDPRGADLQFVRVPSLVSQWDPVRLPASTEPLRDPVTPPDLERSGPVSVALGEESLAPGNQLPPGPPFQSPALVAEFEPQRGELVIEVEGLPVGRYDIESGGVPRGELQVEALGNGSYGRLVFRHPTAAAALPLNFDPRGQGFILTRNGSTVFNFVLPGDGGPRK